MSRWMAEQSGPYVVTGVRGGPIELDTRQELWELLDALTATERRAAVVTGPGVMGTRRVDGGDYAHDVLRMEVDAG